MPANDKNSSNEEEAAGNKIQLVLSSDEWDSIIRAAKLDGFGVADVAQWVKKVVLGKSSIQIQRQLLDNPDLQHLNISDGDAQQLLGQATCVCGATRDPGGKCDSSCLLQY